MILNLSFLYSINFLTLLTSTLTFASKLYFENEQCDASSSAARLELLERSRSSRRCNGAPPRRADVSSMQCWHRVPNLNFYTFIPIPNSTFSYTLDFANYFSILTHSYTKLMTLLSSLLQIPILYTYIHYTIAFSTHTYFTTFIALQLRSLALATLIAFKT